MYRPSYLNKTNIRLQVGIKLLFWAELQKGGFEVIHILLVYMYKSLNYERVMIDDVLKLYVQMLHMYV